MKCMKILILLALLSLKAYSPDLKVLYVCSYAPIAPYEQIWKAVCKVESSNNPLAIGDKNLKKHSYGIAQIRQSRLDDFNQRTGKHYTTKDMFDVAKSKEVFMHYASGDNETIARNWNGGNRGMQKKSTKKYYKLIQKNL